MEETKYKIPGIFPRRKSIQQQTLQQPRLLLKAVTMVISISGNCSYWAMYHFKVPCGQLQTCRLEILNPGTPFLPSTSAVTLASEFPPKLALVHTSQPQQGGKQLLSTTELVRMRTETCQSQHPDYSGHITQQGDLSSHKGLSESGRLSGFWPRLSYVSS